MRFLLAFFFWFGEFTDSGFTFGEIECDLCLDGWRFVQMCFCAMLPPNSWALYFSMHV